MFLFADFDKICRNFFILRNCRTRLKCTPFFDVSTKSIRRRFIAEKRHFSWMDKSKKFLTVSLNWIEVSIKKTSKKTLRSSETLFSDFWICTYDQSFYTFWKPESFSNCFQLTSNCIRKQLKTLQFVMGKFAHASY